MKKIHYPFFFFLSFSFLSSSQEEEEKIIATTKSKSELIQNKIDGQFYFTLTKNITSEEVDKNSSYYTLYFSVAFDYTTKEAIIKMKINDEKSRHIISRFLTSFGIEYIKSENNTYRLEEFYQKFLK